jgi:hypothetical protein
MLENALEKQVNGAVFVDNALEKVMLSCCPARGALKPMAAPFQENQNNAGNLPPAGETEDSWRYLLYGVACGALLLALAALYVHLRPGSAPHANASAAAVPEKTPPAAPAKSEPPLPAKPEAAPPPKPEPPQAAKTASTSAVKTESLKAEPTDQASPTPLPLPVGPGSKHQKLDEIKRLILSNPDEAAKKLESLLKQSQLPPRVVERAQNLLAEAREAQARIHASAKPADQNPSPATSAPVKAELNKLGWTDATGNWNQDAEHKTAFAVKDGGRLNASGNVKTVSFTFQLAEGASLGVFLRCRDFEPPARMGYGLCLENGEAVYYAPAGKGFFPMAPQEKKRVKFDTKDQHAITLAIKENGLEITLDNQPFSCLETLRPGGDARIVIVGGAKIDSPLVK